MALRRILTASLVIQGCKDEVYVLITFDIVELSNFSINPTAYMNVCMRF